MSLEHKVSSIKYHEGYMESLADITMPQFEELTKPFADLAPEVQSVSQQFSGMNNNIQEVKK